MAMARACWESTRHSERGGCRRAYVVPNRLVPQGKVNQLHAPPPVGQNGAGYVRLEPDRKEQEQHVSSLAVVMAE